MEKTNQKILEEIIRVDHAGERGAIKIYEGQLLALNTLNNLQNTLSPLNDMLEERKRKQKELQNKLEDHGLPKFMVVPIQMTLTPAWEFIISLMKE